MAETKDEIAAQRDALLAENENLRGQLAAAGGRVVRPQHTFMLSEGARQELQLYGVTNIDGRRWTIDEVRAKLAEQEQDGVEIADPDPSVARTAAVGLRPQGKTPGVDFVYPSVAPGQIDPAVAGLPGINGPAAPSVAPDQADPVAQ